MRRNALGFFAACLLLGLVGRDASADEETVVRVNVHLQREREVAEAFVERRGSWTSACHAPCSFDAKPGERVRIDVDDKIDDSLVFTVPDDGRRVHDVEVRRRGEGHLKGGLIAIGAGAISLALGMAIIRGAGKDDLFGDGNRAVAFTMMLLGGGSAAAGTYLIFRRSTAPYLSPPPRIELPHDVEAVHATAAPFTFVWTMRF